MVNGRDSREGREGGRERERCEERQERALHTHKDLVKKEKDSEGTQGGKRERVEKSGIRHKKRFEQPLLSLCHTV